MDLKRNFTLSKFSLIVITTMFHSHLLASQQLNLKDHSTKVIMPFLYQTANKSSLGNTKQVMQSRTKEASLKEVSRYTDFNQVTHIRMQEYYGDFPIWNAYALLHVRQTENKLLPTDSIQSMNGKLYDNIDADLKDTPAFIFTKEQASKALQFVMQSYRMKIGDSQLSIVEPNYKLSIFIDDNHKAHWAYHINFDVPPTANQHLPAKPNYLVDAITFKTYKTWNEIKTHRAPHKFVTAGGFGGNEKIGQFIYDGQKDHLATFAITRKGKTCYFENDDIVVRHAISDEVMNFPCAKQDLEHHVYWSYDFDHINGAYSPSNDAMYNAQIIKDLYKKWYNTPVLVKKDGSEMVLTMAVHVPHFDNAYWDGTKMTFGDGKVLYPLTSLNISAHEVSHGFTEQHANLDYMGQSGGMNEAFSDMAGKVAEYYAYGKIDWVIGPEVFKIDQEVMRYMDRPSQDCHGKLPGSFCSIDNANEYYDGLDVHFSSGVYNRAFYLLSTMPDWNPRKAFAVMLQANASYWLPQTEYKDGAECAVQAARDLNYDAEAVQQAFQMVGIKTDAECTNNKH